MCVFLSVGPICVFFSVGRAYMCFFFSIGRAYMCGFFSVGRAYTVMGKKAKGTECCLLDCDADMLAYVLVRTMPEERLLHFVVLPCVMFQTFW